jgi:hypothetical protein
VFTFCVLEVEDAQLEGLVVSHGHRLSVIIMYNSNVAGFIAVTDDAFIVPDLSIRSMPESFVLAVTVSWTESNPSLCSLHQVSSIRWRLSSCTLGLVSPLSGASRAVFRP